MDVDPFFFCQPLGLFRKVGNEEECGQGDDAGQEAFEDEYPAPGVVASSAVHLADCTSEKASKRGGELRRAEEEGISTLRFGAFVPHAD